jgi:hypothetical protein
MQYEAVGDVMLAEQVLLKFWLVRKDTPLIPNDPFRAEDAAGGGGAGRGVGALGFNPSGDALSAWVPADGTLYVWHLVAKWKLQRNAFVLIPTKVKPYYSSVR